MQFTKKMFEPRLYTSYFSKMCEETKGWDIYVQVSRTVFCPKKNKDGIKITDLIDYNWGEIFGMWESTLERYYKLQLTVNDSYKAIHSLFEYQERRQNELICYYGGSDNVEEALKTLNERLEDGDSETIDLYNDLISEKTAPKIVFLCHENLEAKYTSQDEKKFKSNKCGEFKKCHRRVFAKFINDNYDEFIPEWNIDEGNKSIVYRDYF